MSSDKFWFKDFPILFDKDRLTEFFPNKYMSHSEKLNAILRFSIYASILLIMYYRNGNLLIIPLFIAGLTLYIHKYSKLPMDDDKIERLIELEGECKIPTKDNPFMNLLVHELNDGPKKQNCSIEDEDVKEEIEQHFNHNLYKDVNDIYDKNNSQRQYFTVPQTDEFGAKAGDSVAFAKWLWNIPKPTCKEDAGQCTGTFNGFHNDLRYGKQQLVGEETLPPY